MIAEFPDIDEVLRPEILEVEQNLELLEEIRKMVKEGDQLLAEEAKLAEWTRLRILALEMISAAWLAWEFWNLLDSLSIEAKRLAKNKEGRKVKTMICVTRAARVIELHREAVRRGNFTGKEMKTIDSVKRHKRSFQSRS